MKLPELNSRYLVAGGVNIVGYRRKLKVYMGTVFAFDPGKTVAEIATIQISLQNQFDMGSKEAVPSFKTIFISFRKKIGYPRRGRVTHLFIGIKTPMPID